MTQERKTQPLDAPLVSSVLVYPGNRYLAVRGDWTGIASDGSESCACASVHDTYGDARTAAAKYRADEEESWD